MPSSDGDSFLPRIQSVFYAVFDVRQGPKIVYQVPEGLIAVSNAVMAVGTTSLSTSSSPGPVSPGPERPPSRSSGSSTHSRPDSRSLQYPQKRSFALTKTLFNFDEISTYVIPRSALCGRLVICATRKYRIIGFPVELRGDYDRNYFRYNLCFVFERTADLSCYEPIVRKVSRVLTACEEESSFLSSPQNSANLYAILEQLYEDLNSYSETSIPIDEFNSVELKIFPFYPNPPPVKDWQVPLALINLAKRIESNWDLTVVKMCKFIDGTNHVSRIAHLADCDLELTRQAISHLLYYQVIMMIDIFQYSNMYTLRKNVQWLADEAHVREECGPYVTKPGKDVVDWPKLLHLYSRLRPGRTVLEWMEAYDVHELGVDVRRFTSFGVIKGFLRRVHRWPVLLPEDPDALKIPDISVPFPRARAESFTSLSGSPQIDNVQQRQGRGRPSELPPILTSVSPQLTLNSPTKRRESFGIKMPIRKSSAAEQILEKLQSQPRPGQRNSPQKPNARDREDSQAQSSPNFSRTSSDNRRLSTSTFFNLNITNGTQISAAHPPPSPLLPRPRYSRSPSAPVVTQVQTSNSQGTVATATAQSIFVPPRLMELLDGEHHTDELATQFEAGWPLLEQWLIAAGKGKGDGDFVV